jgi:branched-chain amino acid transport system substrate-binding protein
MNTKNPTLGGGFNRRKFLSGGATAAIGAGALGAAFLKDMNNGARAQGAPIPIGSMLPLTGAAASDGIGGQYGLELAIEEINAMGGILGRPLEPRIVDTKNMSAEDAVSAANLLIERDGVHAITCVYNIGPNNAEYEPIADAGIIYMHVNTSILHQQTVMKDPERYFGCFMFCPPETFYGTNLPVVLDRIRASGAWKPDNNKIAIAVGSLPYSIVIAQKIKEAAPQYGFEVVFDEVVPTPTTEWGAVLDKMRSHNPAVIANTHFFAGDLANFQRQFYANPTNSLVYLQYGALLQSFAEVARDAAVGVLTSSMISVLPDERGSSFIAKMKQRHGDAVNYDPASYVYSEVYQYAIAAAFAGGTGEPGNYDQNRRIAAALKAFPFRSVCGSVAYHPEWQCAVPYPTLEKDPSLGLPSPTYQIKSANGTKELIFPEPYANSAFEIPSWFK